MPGGGAAPSVEAKALERQGSVSQAGWPYGVYPKAVIRLLEAG